MEKNKVVFGIVAIMLLILGSVMVVGMDDVLVECGEGWFNSDVCRDFELQDEFDSVTDYINSKESAWSKDEVGGGIGVSRVYKVLGINTNDIKMDFLTYISNIFATRAEVNALHERADMLEAKINLLNTGQEITDDSVALMTGMIKSSRTGEKIVVGDYTCRPKYCVKVGPVTN